MPGILRNKLLHVFFSGAWYPPLLLISPYYAYSFCSENVLDSDQGLLCLNCVKLRLYEVKGYVKYRGLCKTSKWILKKIKFEGSSYDIAVDDVSIIECYHKIIEIWARIVVLLIMTLSRGHTGQIKRTVIMRWFRLPHDGNKVVPWRD